MTMIATDRQRAVIADNLALLGLEVTEAAREAAACKGRITQLQRQLQAAQAQAAQAAHRYTVLAGRLAAKRAEMT